MSAARHAGLRVLVVEDQYLIARQLAAMLAEVGCEAVGPVPDIAAARRELETRAVDAAMLDVALRGGTVYELADELAARAIPFVFVSGYDHGDLPERFAGHPHLEKPVQRARLVRALEHLVPDSGPQAG